MRFIDSHTGGEPTRILIDGGPDLGSGSMAERLNRMREQHDGWRSALVNEPRGSDVLVGALLCAPVDPANACGVIFFNNVGYLGMCGHGTIGLVATLAYLGRIAPGEHRIETPVGVVTARLAADGGVTVANVPSYRYAKAVAVEVPGHGRVHGDVAWGGNWFFLCEDHGLPLNLAHAEALTDLSWRIRQALQAQGISGADGQEIDHIELMGPAQDAANHGRNFVLCPGKAYDRSPCGTGTSAKIACLAAAEKLAPGQVWRQESVIGSVFEASYRIDDKTATPGHILPSISGRAFVNMDATLVFQPGDPFAWGIGRDASTGQPT
ncbi:proline racemase family protein [Paucibacter sp. AS339]|uniref:proline racemase family protein n=1 Tax=Paucibacter hankyongi TaxID=3133434 RepID=UPI0030AC4800